MSTAGMMGIYQVFGVVTLCCCVSASTFRRNVVPSSSRITAADLRTKLMFLICTPGDSVNSMVTSD